MYKSMYKIIIIQSQKLIKIVDDKRQTAIRGKVIINCPIMCLLNALN